MGAGIAAVAEGVGSEDDRECGTGAEPGFDERERGEGAADQECQADREDDGPAGVRPMTVPIIRPAISPMAYPVRQRRVADKAIEFRPPMSWPSCPPWPMS